MRIIRPKLKRYEDSILVEKLSPRWMRVYGDTEVFGVNIKDGYVTNGASVPRLFWIVLSPFTEGFRAALVHDYRYTDEKFTDRRKADIEFYYNLKKDSVGIFRRLLAYYAVRLFGWAVFVYPEHEEDDNG